MQRAGENEELNNTNKNTTASTHISLNNQPTTRTKRPPPPPHHRSTIKSTAQMREPFHYLVTKYTVPCRGRCVVGGVCKEGSQVSFHDIDMYMRYIIQCMQQIDGMRNACFRDGGEEPEARGAACTDPPSPALPSLLTTE